MPTITHDPNRKRKEITYTREEVEALIWRDCEARGYRVRPEVFAYASVEGRLVGIEVRVPETDGPAEPSSVLVDFLLDSPSLRRLDSEALVRVGSALAADQRSGRSVAVSGLRMVLGGTLTAGYLFLRELERAGWIEFWLAECPHCQHDIELAANQHLDEAIDCPMCEEEVQLWESVLYRWKEDVDA